MQPPEDGKNRDHKVGQVNLNTNSGNPGVLLAVLLGAGVLIVMIAVLILILTNVFRIG